MKRYRRALNPVLLKHKIEKAIMSEDEEGPWVKYEDVKKLIRSLLNVYSEMTFEISDEEIEEYINSDILEGMLKHGKI